MLVSGYRTAPLGRLDRRTRMNEKPLELIMLILASCCALIILITLIS